MNFGNYFEKYMDLLPQIAICNDFELVCALHSEELKAYYHPSHYSYLLPIVHQHHHQKLSNIYNHICSMLK